MSVTLTKGEILSEFPKELVDEIKKGSYKKIADKYGRVIDKKVSISNRTFVYERSKIIEKKMKKIKKIVQRIQEEREEGESVTGKYRVPSLVNFETDLLINEAERFPALLDEFERMIQTKVKTVNTVAASNLLKFIGKVTKMFITKRDKKHAREVEKLERKLERVSKQLRDCNQREGLKASKREVNAVRNMGRNRGAGVRDLETDLRRMREMSDNFEIESKARKRRMELKKLDSGSESDEGIGSSDDEYMYMPKLHF